MVCYQLLWLSGTEVGEVLLVDLERRPPPVNLASRHRCAVSKDGCPMAEPKFASSSHAHPIVLLSQLAIHGYWVVRLLPEHPRRPRHAVHVGTRPQIVDGLALNQSGSILQPTRCRCSTPLMLTYNLQIFFLTVWFLQNLVDPQKC